MGAFQVMLVVKNVPANSGDTWYESLIPGLGRSSGEGHNNPLQYSCLENPMDRRAWWATVHKVAMSWTQMKWLSTYARLMKRVLQGVRVETKGAESTVKFLISFGKKYLLLNLIFPTPTIHIKTILNLIYFSTWNSSRIHS